MNYYKNNIIYNTKYNNILETNTIIYTKKNNIKRTNNNSFEITTINQTKKIIIFLTPILSIIPKKILRKNIISFNVNYTKKNINKTNNNIFTINTLKINYTKKRILRKLIIIFLIPILVIILKVQAAQAPRCSWVHLRGSRASVRWRCAAGLRWRCPSATWRLVCPRPSYFGSCPARPKVTLGPFLAVPKPKRHLALGLQRKGSMSSAMWRLGCLPS